MIKVESQHVNKKTRQGFRKSLGHVVSLILRKECQFLIRKGLSVSFAKKLAIFINLFILISLLFILFPMWMGLVTLIIGALLLAGVDIDVITEDEPEWKNGISGYGLYRGDIRIDIYDNDD